MAEDKKISELTALGEKLATADEIAISDASAGATKSVTIDNLVGNTTSWDYIVYDDSGTYRAVDGATGAEDSNNTDCGALLNALFDKISIGGRIYIKPTATKISLDTTQLTLDVQGITLEGGGRSSAEAFGVEFECTTVSVNAITISKDDIKFKNFRISGNTSDSAIAITQANHLAMDNIYISSPNTHLTPFGIGISLEPTGTQTCQISVFRDILILGCDNGIVFNGAVGASCGNNEFDNIRILQINTSGTYMWFKERCDHNRISNIQFGTVNKDNCIIFQYGESGGINNHISGQSITNAHIGVQNALTVFNKVWLELVMTGLPPPATFTNLSIEGNGAADMVVLAEANAIRPEFYGVMWAMTGSSTLTGTLADSIIVRGKTEDFQGIDEGTFGTLACPNRTTADNTILDGDLGAVNGAMGINTNDNFLYYRVGGSWRKSARADTDNTFSQNQTIAQLAVSNWSSERDENLANDTAIGQYKFRAHDFGGSLINYVTMTGKMDTDGDGTETGTWLLRATDAGGEVDVIKARMSLTNPIQMKFDVDMDLGTEFSVDNAAKIYVDTFGDTSIREGTVAEGYALNTLVVEAGGKDVGRFELNDPLTLTDFSAVTTAPVPALVVVADTSGSMGNNFGPQILFKGIEASGALKVWGSVAANRSTGNDDNGLIRFEAYNSGTVGPIVSINGNGNLTIEATARINLDGNTSGIGGNTYFTEQSGDDVHLVVGAVVMQAWDQDILETQFAEGVDFVFGTTTGSIIGTDAAQKLAFYGSTAIVQPIALTSPLTTLTNAGTASDFAIQALTSTTPFGFVTQAEGETVVDVVLNNQARINEIETKLQALGLLA